LSDLDTNTHLHSACYLRLAIDQLGRHRALDPAQDMLIVNAIHLQYIQEVNFGQRLLIASKNTEDDPDAFLVEGRVEGADNPSFLARLEGRIVAR
jgi:acyl-ACP thioesterase